MTDKELKKLNRRELLEMLITQTGEIEQLKKDLEDAKSKIADREIKSGQSGSIAEAALALNGVFEAAQSAADQYLANIRDSESICTTMLDEAKQKAQQIISEAEEKTNTALTEAENKAQQIVSEAEEKAKARELSSKCAAESYWNEVSSRLEKFYDEHEGLKALLKNLNNGEMTNS